MLVCEGEIGELVQPGDMWGLPWGLLCGTSVRKELCMVPCHSRHIYEIWTSRSKKVWGMLKSYKLQVVKVTKGEGTLFICKAGSHYVTLLYCENLLQVLLGIYCNWFYWLPLFTITVVLRVWGLQGQIHYINIKWAIPENFLGFFLYPLEIPDKTKFTPRNST